MDIGVSGNVTLGIIEVALKEEANSSREPVNVFLGSFSSLKQDLEAFIADELQQVLICIDTDKVLEALEWEPATVEREHSIEKLSDLYIAQLEACRSLLKEFAFVGIAAFSLGSTINRDFESTARRAQGSFERKIAERFGNEANMAVIDVQTTLNAHGLEKSISQRERFKSMSPLTLHASRLIAENFFVSLRMKISPMKKVLVLDADNTLWSGVIGEVGAQGIGLSSNSFPGNIFVQAQRCFKSLKDQGVLLVLLSKNEERDVFEVLENHPEQILRREDFAIVSANWKDKVDRLEEIAQQLSLGLDSFVFVDDSDFEVRSAQKRIPDVLTLQIPHQLSNFPAFLRELMTVPFARSSGSDRTEKYRVRAEAESLRLRSQSKDAFLNELSTRLEISENDPFQVNRLHEMSSRTNQFNLSMRRLNLIELEALLESPTHTVLGVRVHDIFGDHGVSAGLVYEVRADTLMVTDFWVSCRVLGREIEESLIAHVMQSALERGCRKVDYCIVKGLRNQQVWTLLAGFPGSRLIASGKESIFRVMLTEENYSCSDYIQVVKNAIR